MGKGRKIYGDEWKLHFGGEIIMYTRYQIIMFT